MINSCVALPLTTDPMHGFLRDKQAWENAISTYQGPDPLDHWYNYISWYENHLRGDPENKFRETLERCLALFEHSEFYKQDIRMVRLWLKYIEMQTHPLHFYQVLYQRGVGRQVAAFYIGWATYYQSINALKEAESVYSLAFQEKAQSFEELHHAHNKFLYMQAAGAQMVVHNQQQQQQALGQQQQTNHQHQQQMHTVQYHGHGQPQPIAHAAAAAQPHHQTHQTQMQATAQMQPQQLNSPQQIYQRQITTANANATASNSYYQPHAHANMQAQQEQHLYQQQHPSYQNSPATYQAGQTVAANQFNNGAQYNNATENSVQTAQGTRTMPSNTERVEHERPYNTTNQIQQEQMSAAMSRQTIQTEPMPIPLTATLSGCRLPRKFATYCHNNYETWRPALFLEEPDDPNRRCHYAKMLVYPGTGCEYSPEELLAKKYLSRINVNNVKEQITQHKQVIEAVDNGEAQTQELQEIGVLQQQQQQQAIQQHSNDAQNLQHKYRNSTNEHFETNGVNSIEHQHQQAIATYAQMNLQQQQQNSHHVQHNIQNRQEQQQIEQQPPDLGQEEESQPSSDYGNPMYDLEDQIEASTIRLGENKTIKIKFKKEKQQHGHILKGNNYVIEGIYQQEVSKASPFTPEHGRLKNGHNFHPYNMDNTSTPKSSVKRYKSKLKSINRLPIEAGGSSSNSSFAENGEVTNGNGTAANTTLAHVQSVGAREDAMQNASYNDNANYSFSSAAALDNSQCSLSSAVGRMNFREASSIYNTSNIPDASICQENSFFATQHDAEAKERRLQKALEVIEQHMAKEAIDPFNSELCRAFLTKLAFPGSDDSCANYKIMQTPLPKIANTRTLNLPDGMQFNIDKEVGRGSYGSVYKATDANTGNVVALKFQKPPNTWEIYICDQVLKRVKSKNILPGLMDISTAIIAPNASIIATEFSPFGSLLDINNKIRQATKKVMHESLVMHFSAQICDIISHLHMNKIIHADIKPDNFLLMRIPNTDYHYPSLRLIDFGCAIDMTLFPDPDSTKFRKVIQTDGFTCIEMQEGRSWSYETDLFCIAGTVHVMLLGEYMQLQKRAGLWDIKQKLPRYLKKHVWSKFFGDVLNIKNAELPNLNEMRRAFEQEAARMDSELQSQIRTLSNILHRR